MLDPMYESTAPEDAAIMASLESAVLEVEEDDEGDSAHNRSHTQPRGHLNNSSSLTTTSSNSLPDVLFSNELQSLNLNADSDRLSFCLLDENEGLVVDTAQIFAARLGCDVGLQHTKVLSIIGNTGEGKSHTLNHCLFEGRDVFNTSPTQDSCTSGIWAAYQPCLQLLVLDTEGMLGKSGNENRRTRQLMKILAISDVVIYKTKAERLHNDLFHFLGDASKAFNDYFSEELRKVGDDMSVGETSSATSGLGPSVIISHETKHTDVLSEASNGVGIKSAEGVIRERLSGLKEDVTAFCRISYIGSRMDISSRGNSSAGSSSTGISSSKKGGSSSPTHFEKLRRLIDRELKDTNLRSPRSVELIYETLKALTVKFSTDIPSTNHRSFPDEYFTCVVRCSSCECRCSKAVSHAGSHKTDSVCVYQKRLDNKVYLCLRCYQDGRRNVVVPKACSATEGPLLGLATYVWSGYVLECNRCGVIFKSRERWFGNEDPEKRSVVQTEIEHIWPGTRTLQGTHNAARRLLDGVNTLSDTVSTFSSTPSKMVSNWVADRVAPDYWRPNCDIGNCHACHKRFDGQQDKIHHCRACGEGFCDACSEHKRPVMERGWGEEPVRVCKRCYGNYSQQLDSSTSSDPGEIQARRYSERVVGTLSSLVSVFDYPISVLKDSARPDYWVPDEEISKCHVCSKAFDKSLGLHHCRSCGNGVCDPCSRTSKPVPLRGWDTPVRVCDRCV